MEEKIEKEFTIKNGSVLIAEPFLSDPNFKRSVILITDHLEAEGTVGFVINQLLDYKIGELVEGLEEFEFPVYNGGPVSFETLHFLHNMGDLIEGSLKVSQGVYWGGDFNKVIFLIQSKLIKEHNIRFFMGYSGWSPNQLKEEIEEGTWILEDMDPNFLFNMKHEKIWESILDIKGNHYSALSQIDGDSIMN